MNFKRLSKAILDWQVGCGRTRLHFHLQRFGRDLTGWLEGGESHIGAVAAAFVLKNGRVQVRTLTLPGHREGAIARALAVQVARRWNCSCSVVCGIHLDAITRREIATVLRRVRKICKRIKTVDPADPKITAAGS
ncbi:MAG: hypothetical protein PHV34_03575 [Verrucomicrobiae bacterium]|nr:hypothetical protein [Verrucomicrobiae bacterium]